MSVCASCLLETGHTLDCYYTKHPIKAPYAVGPPTPPSTPRIALVDGDTTTPLSAEALVVALFACDLIPVRSPIIGQIVGWSFDREKVTTMAVQMQAVLDQGQSIGLQKDRIARPTNGGGLVGS